jgi:RNA polymerase sigma factor (sigma-70 family)
MDETRAVEQYRSPVLYFVLRRVRDRSTAEEITQETLLILLQALRENRLREEDKIGAYIFGIAKNLILKNYRMHVREAEPPDPDSEKSGWVHHPEAEFFLEEERRGVRRALALLSDQDREILRYSFAEKTEGLEDVASELGIPYAAARKRKSRALERLRKILVQMSQKGSP